MEVATKRRLVNLVKEVDKKQKLEGAEAEKEVHEKRKLEGTEAKKTVAKKKKVESTEAKEAVAKNKKVKSTKAKKAAARKKRVVSSDEEYLEIIEPMDDLVDDTDYYTSSEEELTPSGARFVSIVRKG